MWEDPEMTANPDTFQVFTKSRRQVADVVLLNDARARVGVFVSLIDGDNNKRIQPDI